MKDILIVFGVLLVLVILISTFGGSLRVRERYEEDPAAASKAAAAAAAAPPTPSADAQSPPPSVPGPDGPPPSGVSPMQTMQPVVEGFDGGAYAGFQEDDAAEDDSAEEAFST